MPRPISYAVFCSKKKKQAITAAQMVGMMPCNTDALTNLVDAHAPLEPRRTAYATPFAYSPQVFASSSLFFLGHNQHHNARSFPTRRSSDLSTRAVSSNPNFVTRQKIEIIFG